MGNLINLRTIALVLASLLAIASFGQKVTVRGTVVDAENQEPLIGVSVIEKGTTNGVTSDIDGNFTISVNQKATLSFSYVGYTAQDVKATVGAPMTIKLTSSSVMLEEMVVIGYGVQRKSDVTGSISSLSAEDVNDVPVANAVQALQGKAAGVNVIQNTGAPGSNTTIKIRGTGTVNDADPLYVVDGFIVDDIDHINPNDIANVEIFKDAASSSVYGARAANGVVVITTKSGESGKTKITFDGYVGISNPWREIDVMDTENYALMTDYINGTSTYSADGQMYMTKQADGTYVFDDHKKFLIDTIRNNSPEGSWWDAISRTGFKQQYNLSVSGGTEKTKYMISGSFYDENGIINTSDYRRFNTRINVSQQLAKWLNLTANMSYANENQNSIPEGSSSILKQALYQSPMTLMHNLRGYWNSGHPVAVIDRYHNQTIRHRLDMNMSLLANIGKYLTYQFKASYFLTPSVNKTYSEVGKLEDEFSITDLSTVYRNAYQSDKWEINNLLTFHWNNDAHDVTVLAGQTAEGYKYEYQQSTRKGTPSNDDVFQYLSSAYTGDKTYGLEQSWNAVGFIGRVNYNALDRYLLQANIRIDGSSKFSKENRWGYFPSVSAGWKFSSEPFMDGAEWMNLGKLRLGWGILGNNRIDELARYTYLSTQYNYPYGQGNHILQPGVTALTIGNPDIKWEKTETFNVGLDFGFLNNSITWGIEYFDKRTTDMLIAVPVVSSAGLNSAPMTNAGSVRNNGIETTFNYRKTFGKFSFDLGFNFSWIKNTVTSLGTGNEPIYGAYLSEGSIVDYVTKTAVGLPIGSFFGYVTDGIFQSYEEVKASAQYEPGKLDHEQTTLPGDFRFKDLNGDNQITAEDRTYLGSPLPDFVYGIPLQFSYDNFDLNIFFQGQQGNEIYNVTDYYLMNAANGNVYADIRSQHWSGQVAENRQFFPLNTTASVPDLDKGDAARNFRSSDFFVQDGSYLRLKELSLTYNLPKSLISKWSMSNLSISLTGYNLLTFTNYRGLDPEVGKVVGTEGNNLSMGVDHGTYPQARAFLLGLKIGL